MIQNKVIYKAYKYRLYPDADQEIFLHQHFGAVRFVYNRFLALRKEAYEKDKKKKLPYTEQAAMLADMKKQEEYSWLKAVNSQSLQYSLKCLEKAYERFFKHLAKYPKFHKRKNGGAFTVPQHFCIEDGLLFIPKMKRGIPMRMHRKMEGEARSLTITLSPGGKYHVCILCRVAIPQMEKTNLTVGIDLGLKDLAVTSDGERHSVPNKLKKLSSRLATAQKHLSRKVKGSSSWNRQRIKVARLHERISDSRSDILHKLTTDLVRRYDVICCEDLNVKGMVRNHRLARSISNVSWGMLIAMLAYKCEWYGKTLVRVDRYYPSSKTCHTCGYKYNDLSLSEREWICPQCGNVIDRDLNAAMNIHDEGLRILNNKEISAGTVDYTDGEEVRPHPFGAGLSSVKSEATKSLLTYG